VLPSPPSPPLVVVVSPPPVPLADVVADAVDEAVVPDAPLPTMSSPHATRAIDAATVKIELTRAVVVSM